MKILLLPGLDGTGKLFATFIEALSASLDAEIISYPDDKKLCYNELVDLVLSQLPKQEFVLLAESFSGPIAYEVAVRNPNNLKLVVFVASFLTSPRPMPLALINWLPWRHLKLMPLPKFIIKSILLGSNASDDLIATFKRTIKQMPPELISYRFCEIAKLSQPLTASEVSSVYIQASEDKLVPKSCLGAFENTMADIRVAKVFGPHFLLRAEPVACVETVVNEIHRLKIDTDGSSR